MSDAPIPAYPTDRAPTVCRTLGELRAVLAPYPDALAVQGDLELALAVRYRPAEVISSDDPPDGRDAFAIDLPERLEIYGTDDEEVTP